MATEQKLHWRRGLRPLIWWVGFVAVLYAYHTHERLSEQTKCAFSISLAGRLVDSEAAVKVGDQSFNSGSRIPIGWHRLTIMHEKAEPYSTNLFIWYGENNLGELALKRSKGSLVVTASPAARLIEIRGSDFVLKLTNSPGITIEVPTDRYTVSVDYQHWQQAQQIAVTSSSPGSASFSPRVGAIQLTCNQSGASFQVLNARQQLMEAGKFPAMIREMPEGNYALTALHHGNKYQQTLTVKAGATNGFDVQFNYGAAFLESDPPGAMVTDADGRELGVTPMVLSEVKAGAWEFALRLSDYEPATGSITVTANGTNSFHTNLVSHFYTLAMENARRSYAGRDYERAAEATAEALKHKPNDPAAMNLERDATGQAHLTRAKTFAERGAYTDAIKEVNAGLTLLSEDVNAIALLADYTSNEQQRIQSEKKRAAELAEQETNRQQAELAARQRQQRLDNLNEVFRVTSGTFENAPMFANHELTGTNSAANLAPVINYAMTNGEPAFQMVRFDWPKTNIFIMQARQRLGLGYRDCLIVGGQLQEHETRILFKILHYDHLPELNLLGGLLHITPEIRVTTQSPQMVQEMVERNRQRTIEGFKLINGRIEGAMGQTSPGK